MVGKTVEVMVEGVSKLVSKQQKAYPSAPTGTVQLRIKSRRGDEGLNHSTDRDPSPTEQLTQLVGRTRGDQVVAFDGDPGIKGKLIDVEITDAKNLTLFARLKPAPVAV